MSGNEWFELLENDSEKAEMLLKDPTKRQDIIEQIVLVLDEQRVEKVLALRSRTVVRLIVMEAERQHKKGNSRAKALILASPQLSDFYEESK